jgi:2-oxoisovalerate dehydrogenase E1 component beta subunit
MATVAQAIRMALHYGEKNLELKNVFGEDVGPPLGGAFTVTQGLETSWNSPLDERGIVGAAMGLGMAGVRSVAEIQFCDYIYNTIDLLKLAGMQSWASNGDWNLPMTIMTPVGAGIRGSIYHSHSFDAMMTHIPGWKIVMPSTPLDAYGLMLSCLKDENPTMYLMPKALLRFEGKEQIPGEPELTPEGKKQLRQMIDMPILGSEAQKTWKPKWPKLEEFTVEIGKGKITREGEHVTVVTYGRHVHIAGEVADRMAEEGISVEVIDMRTLWPYDWDMISTSIRKTKRVIFLNEDTEVTNFGEHLLRRAIDEFFYELEAKPKLIAGAFVPGVGLADPLEAASVPQALEIENAVRELVGEFA